MQFRNYTTLRVVWWAFCLFIPENRFLLELRLRLWCVLWIFGVWLICWNSSDAREAKEWLLLDRRILWGLDRYVLVGHYDMSSAVCLLCIMLFEIPLQQISVPFSILEHTHVDTRSIVRFGMREKSGRVWGGFVGYLFLLFYHNSISSCEPS